MKTETRKGKRHENSHGSCKQKARKRKSQEKQSWVMQTERQEEKKKVKTVKI